MVETEPSMLPRTRRDSYYPFKRDGSLSKLTGQRTGKARQSGVHVSDQTIVVRAPHRGKIVIPRGSVSRVWHVRAKNHRAVLRPALLLGVWTDFRGHWWLVGSLDKLVAIDIDPPAAGRVWGIPIRPRRVVVSVEDPDHFISDVLV